MSKVLLTEEDMAVLRFGTRYQVEAVISRHVAKERRRAAGYSQTLDLLGVEYRALVDGVRALVEEWSVPYGEFTGHPDDVARLRALVEVPVIPDE